MLEYIQGEGGVNALEQAFVDAVFEKCAARDILVMADEVQTGVGRTGTFLAGEQFGHKADVTDAGQKGDCRRSAHGRMPCQ